MPQEILLKFLDGQTVSACLAAPFRPAQHDIEVILPEGGLHFSYSLHDLCYILWSDETTVDGAGPASPFLEDVQTVTGDRFAVYPQALVNFSGGFHGVPADQNAPYKLIFFTSNGIRQRSQRRPIGEVLIQHGLLPPTEVTSALVEQELLRQRLAGEVIANHSQIPFEAVEDTLQTAEVDPDQPRSVRVGDILVEAGLVSRVEVEAAMTVQQNDRNKRVGELLIERGLINEAQLLSALATKFGMRFVDLENQIPSLDALAVIPRELAAQLQILPLQLRRGTLVVATAQPNDPDIGDTLRSATNRPLELVVARSRQIAEALERFYPCRPL